MTQGIKKLLRKFSAALLEPLLAGMVTQHLITLNRQNQILLSLKFREIVHAQGKGLDFEQVGFNRYSATYEDGILLYIFSLIGTTNKKCVDIGAGTVNGSNVANLIASHGFKGLVIDGDPRNIRSAADYYTSHPETRLRPPRLVAAMVTAENANRILMEHGYTGEIDLLAIDIDGMDYWVWKGIDVVNPRVVVVEYQDILGPERAWTVPYKPDFNLRDYRVNDESNNYCGASLTAFVQLGRRKGYRLVGCNKGGWNAFFIREGLGERYLPEVTVESCFRYDWNKFGEERRFPLIKDMEWQEV